MRGTPSSVYRPRPSVSAAVRKRAAATTASIGADTGAISIDELDADSCIVAIRAIPHHRERGAAPCPTNLPCRRCQYTVITLQSAEAIAACNGGGAPGVASRGAQLRRLELYWVPGRAGGLRGTRRCFQARL